MISLPGLIDKEDLKLNLVGLKDVRNFLVYKDKVGINRQPRAINDNF